MKFDKKAKQFIIEQAVKDASITLLAAMQLTEINDFINSTFVFDGEQYELKFKRIKNKNND